MKPLIELYKDSSRVKLQTNIPIAATRKSGCHAQNMLSILKENHIASKT
jgi:hypothetical protein